jgi:glycosyltransferase involved in cell wall biosynthesis
MIASPSNNPRPGLAIIANCLTPYRVHLHELIAAGIPELQLHTLVTHDDADFKWKMRVPDSIHVTHFGRTGDSPLASTFHAPIYEWRKGGRLIDYLRQHDIRFVICNGYRYLSYMRVINYCHRNRLPLFVHSDSNIRSERRLSTLAALAKRKVYGWWVPRVAGFMPMGELGEEFFAKYGGDRRRFYRLPCTPDYDAFASLDEARLEGFRRQYGLCGSRRYLMYSGRLAPVKRVDLVIDAFAQLAAQRPDWDLLIVGDGPLAEELHRRVPENASRRVIWTRFLEQEELKLAYQAADVLVLPSDHEPWAVVVQEAMAAGLVVVASDVVGAAHDLIVDGQSGRIVPTGNVDALRQALLDVTAEEALSRYKEQSRLELKAWRERVQPVAEIRRALADARILAAS